MQQSNMTSFANKCQIKGHESNNITHFCSKSDCNRKGLACDLCILEFHKDHLAKCYNIQAVTSAYSKYLESVNKDLLENQLSTAQKTLTNSLNLLQEYQNLFNNLCDEFKRSLIKYQGNLTNQLAFTTLDTLTTITSKFTNTEFSNTDDYYLALDHLITKIEALTISYHDKKSHKTSLDIKSQEEEQLSLALEKAFQVQNEILRFTEKFGDNISAFPSIALLGLNNKNDEEATKKELVKPDRMQIEQNSMTDNGNKKEMEVEMAYQEKPHTKPLKIIDYMPIIMNPKVLGILNMLGSFSFDDKESGKVYDFSKFHKSYEYDDDTIYIGELNPKSLREGKGKAIWPDESIYEGYWVNDKPTMQGRKILSTGEYYIGQFQNGLYNGQGKLFLANGDQYEGQFMAGKKHGYGVLRLDNGEIYEGDFEKDKMTGEGTYIYSDGDTYQGNWMDDNRSGKGIYRWANGNCYEGEFKENKFHGKGKLVYKAGGYYNGEWAMDQKHGKGIEQWADGGRYEGGYQNGKRHGYGKHVYTSGNTYEGEWVQGKFSGLGVYKYANQDMYIGQFNDTQRNGKGKFITSLGEWYEGDWYSGSKHGNGKEFFLTGEKYEGGYKNGLFSGHGEYKFSNGDKYTGDFENGVFQGKGIFASIDGSEYEGMWSCGKKNGKGVLIKANGERQEEEWNNNVRIK